MLGSAVIGSEKKQHQGPQLQRQLRPPQRRQQRLQQLLPPQRPPPQLRQQPHLLQLQQQE